VKLLKIIVINVVTFAVLLVIVNWACGVYLEKRDKGISREELPNYDHDHAHARQVFKDYHNVKHEYEPFVGWKCLPYEGETLTISQNGERLHSAPESTIPNKKSVRFFGGSTMWGEGSDGQHTIPALFNVLNPQYEVTNHAQLAYNTRQELDALISFYSKNQHADVVIFYDGVNDAAFLCPKEIDEMPAHRLVPMYREKLYAGKTQVLKTLLAKVFYANIMKTVRTLTTEPTVKNSPYDCISTPGKAEEIAEILMKNWEMANEIVTKRGGRFIAILQPAAYIGKPRTDHLNLDKDLGRNFAEVYKQIRQKIKDRNHPWIYDLSDKFDGSAYIYIDFCHVSPNGNQIMAEEISKVVKSENEISGMVSNVR
jgi:hypothetical protein